MDTELEIIPISQNELDKSPILKAGETAIEFLEDVAYEVTYDSFKLAEGVADAGMSIVADIGGLFDESFKEKVEEIVSQNLTSETLLPFASLNNGSFEKLGEEGKFIELVAKTTGYVAFSTLVGPLAGAAIIGASHAGTCIEKSIQRDGRICMDITSLNDGSDYKVEVTANSGEFNKTQYVLASFVDTLKDATRTVADIGIKLGETGLDIAGNTTVGLCKFGEGIIDANASLVGLAIPTLRDDIKEFTSYDFTGQTVGKFFDSLTPDSCLNGNKVGAIVECVSQGVGQIAPAIVLSAVTGGAAAAGWVSLGLLSASAAGNKFENAVQEGQYWKACVASQLSGCLEGGIEMIGGLSILGPTIISSSSIVGVMASEGLEEVISAAVDPLVSSIYKGQESIIETIKTPEFVQGLIDSFVIGAATAAIGQGISNVVARPVGTSSIDVETKQVADTMHKSHLVVDGEFHNTVVGEHGYIYTQTDTATISYAQELGYYPDTPRNQSAQFEVSGGKEGYHASHGIPRFTGGDGNVYNLDAVKGTINTVDISQSLEGPIHDVLKNNIGTATNFIKVASDFDSNMIPGQVEYHVNIDTKSDVDIRANTEMFKMGGSFEISQYIDNKTGSTYLISQDSVAGQKLIDAIGVDNVDLIHHELADCSSDASISSVTFYDDTATNQTEYVVVRVLDNEKSSMPFPPLVFDLGGTK